MATLSVQPISRPVRSSRAYPYTGCKEYIDPADSPSNMFAYKCNKIHNIPVSNIGNTIVFRYSSMFMRFLYKYPNLRVACHMAVQAYLDDVDQLNAEKVSERMCWTIIGQIYKGCMTSVIKTNMSVCDPAAKTSIKSVSYYMLEILDPNNHMSKIEFDLYAAVCMTDRSELQKHSFNACFDRCFWSKKWLDPETVPRSLFMMETLERERNNFITALRHSNDFNRLVRTAIDKYNADETKAHKMVNYMMRQNLKGKPLRVEGMTLRPIRDLQLCYSNPQVLFISREEARLLIVSTPNPCVSVMYSMVDAVKDMNPRVAFCLDEYANVRYRKCTTTFESE